MRIDSSTVVLTSERRFYQEYGLQENLTAWADEPATGMLDEGPAVKLELSPEAQELINNKKLEIKVEIPDKDRQKLLLLQKMLQQLTGKKLRFLVPDMQLQNETVGLQVSGWQTAGPVRRQGWGLIYDRRESYRESEQLSFNAAGQVKTADGRVIEFAVQMNMSRQFAVENSLSIRAGDARLTDPLVINLDGGAAELTNTMFSFDLDADGQADQIPFVRSGSGFLTLDLDNDGMVNDGRELFGPTSGDGFAELAGYDSDGNNWIDENDPIYNRLRIWTKDETGQDRLLALGQAGVGAIYLGSVTARFDLKDANNQLQGSARQAGVWLRENGGAGTIQQVDLVI